jgi:hypothetical protein
MYPLIVWEAILAGIGTYVLVLSDSLLFTIRSAEGATEWTEQLNSLNLNRKLFTIINHSSVQIEAEV